MKKLLVCFLSVLLLLPFTVQAEGWLDFFFGSPSFGLTMRYVPVQEEAFMSLDGQMIGRLMAASEDGNMLLIYSPVEIYFWNQSTMSRVPVTFARPEDAEKMTQLAPQAAFNSIRGNLRTEKGKERLEELTAQCQEYLSARGLTAFANMDQISECYSHIVQLGAQCVGISDRWALVRSVYFSCLLAIDLRNGETLILDDRSRVLTICEDKVFTIEGLLNLETREMTPIDQLDLMFAEDDGLTYVNFSDDIIYLCKDGTIMAIGREGPKSDDAIPYHLVNVCADSNRVYSIGSYWTNHGPDTIVATEDERWLLLYNAAAVVRDSVILLDRVTGDITELEAGHYLPLAATKSGFLLWDMYTYVFTVMDPATAEMKKVELGDSFDWSCLDLVAVSGIIGNGLNMYFEPKPLTIRMVDGSAYVHGYFVLEGEE